MRFLAALLWLLCGPALADGLAFPGEPPQLHSSAAFSYPIASGAPPNLITPIFSNILLTSTTSTFYGNFANGVASQTIATASTNTKVPIPIAGTLSGLEGNFTATQANATITSVINGTVSSTTCTVTTNACPGTGSDSFNAGDLLQWQFNPHGGTWAQTTPGQVSAIITASNGQQGALISGPKSGITGTTSYIPIMGGSVLETTDGAASNVMPGPPSTTIGTINALYVWPNAADTNTNQHVYTVFQNGSATGLTCTGANGTVGCCVNPEAGGNMGGVSGATCTAAGASLTVAGGDTISVQVKCGPSGGGTCSQVIPAVGLRWVNPTTTNQVPIAATAINISTSATAYLGLMDTEAGVTPPTTQTTWQLVPNLGAKSLTLSGYYACVQNNPAGSTTRIFQLQSATTATAPSTNAGPSLVLSVAHGACPGANSAAILGGINDNNPADNYVASTGYALDWSMAVGGGTPATSGGVKASVMATIQ